MTAGAAAKEIGVSRQRIQKLMESEDFPKPHRFFNLLLAFRRSEIMAWKQRHRTRRKP